METSVIVPSYKGGRWVERCLASVRNQTRGDCSAIVVDQTGDCRTAASRFGAHYLFISRRGVGLARNIGLKVARGEFIAFLDVDDEWLPGKLEVQIDATKDASYTGVIWKDNGKPTRVIPARPWDFKRWLKNRFIAMSSLVVRKSVLDDVGPFAEDLDGVEDMELIMRIHKKGYRLDAVPEPLTIVNRYPGSLSSSESYMMMQTFKAVTRQYCPIAYLRVFHPKTLQRVLEEKARSPSVG